MEEPGPPAALGPVGGALRDPARGYTDPGLDPRLPPRARLGDDLRRVARQPVRAHGPGTIRPRRDRAIKTDSATNNPTLLDPRMDFSRIGLFTSDPPVTPEPLKAMPPPSPTRPARAPWQPGPLPLA